MADRPALLDEIEITPEMLEAGASILAEEVGGIFPAEARYSDRGFQLLAASVYRAMIESLRNTDRARF